MPYLRDESQDVARAYGAQTTPDIFVIDGEGRLRYRGAPDADQRSGLDAAWLRDALAARRRGAEPSRDAAQGLPRNGRTRDRATTGARPARHGGPDQPQIAHRRGGVAQVLEHGVRLGGTQLVEIREAGTATARAPASRAARTSSGVSPTSTAPVGSPYLSAAFWRAIATSS